MHQLETYVKGWCNFFIAVTTVTTLKKGKGMISCLIIFLNEWWYCITRDNFVRDDGSMGTAAFFEVIFELCLLVLYAVVKG